MNYPFYVDEIELFINHYNQIKFEALKLLHSENIDGLSFEELKVTERRRRIFCIKTALEMAHDEIMRRQRARWNIKPIVLYNSRYFKRATNELARQICRSKIKRALPAARIQKEMEE